MPAVAQEDADRFEGPGPWNSERVLELVDRARRLRHRTFVDSSLWSYRSDARGYVYFFLDRTDTGERTLVKTSQIALDVFWEAPDRTHQKIVGLRDEESLPTDIRYHLDHLTVVQDEFEDRIRLGDGDEVADVTHPVAPEAEEVYDYRLARRLTIRFPADDQEDVQVFEVQVKPKDFDREGFVGSVFIDRATAAIVRMRFTFTPASYVDPYLDYIRISLDNSLWLGEHWLPYRQEAELRRELPQLDFLAGSIIRGRFEIDDYRFNEELPRTVFRGRRVSALPEEERESFPFEAPLYSQLEQEGLETPPSIEEIRERSREVAQDVYLSGLRRLRLYVPSASDVYRFNRSEGHFAGLGASWTVFDDLSLKIHGGWAFGRDEPSAELRLAPAEEPVWTAEAYLDRPVDVGPFPGASGVVNTLGGLLYDEDWTDPYFTSGASVGVDVGAGLTVTAFVEEHDRARVVVDDPVEYRPSLPADEGTTGGIRVQGRWLEGPDPANGLGVGGSLELGAGDMTWVSQRGTVAWARSDGGSTPDLSVRLDAGLAHDPPRQKEFHLGGRGSLLGFPYRAFRGAGFWLLRAEAATPSRWVTFRVFTGIGQTGIDRDPVRASPATPDRPGHPSLSDRPLSGRDDQVKGSLGAGVGLLWDVVRLDLGRGLGDFSEWEFAFSVTKRFHGWL